MRVLFLTHRLPYAPNRGDRLRAYHVLRTLSGHCEINLFSLVHDRAEADHIVDCEPPAASVETAMVPRLRNGVLALGSLLTNRPLTHALLDSPAVPQTLERMVRKRPPDVVLAYCSSMARFTLRPPLDGIPFVLDMVDVDSAKWAALGQRARGPIAWVYRRESVRLSAFEAAAVRTARRTLVVNEREAEILRCLAPGVRVDVVPNGVDLSSLAPPEPPAVSNDVVFCGVMNYVPNVEGAMWLAREVWPLVLRTRPEARLKLVGSDPVSSVRALATQDRSIQVTGTVPDVRPYLWKAALAVAPLRISRGVQNKVLEAVAAGLPTVVTPTVAEGIPAEALGAIRLAETTESFARSIIELLDRTPLERRAMAGAADLRALAWPVRLAPLLGILEDAAKAGPRR